MKRLTITLACAVFSVASFAQTLKLGYTSVEYILAYMPEAQTVKSQLSEYESQLAIDIQSQYESLQQELVDFEQNSATMSDPIKVQKQQRIQRLQALLEHSQREAKQLLQNKELQLLEPIYKKIQETINAVAQENGFTHIFNSDALLYAPEGEDVSELVLRKMGITIPRQN
ncbi:MAG: OmpH family outer membrane protein [Flavobacteriia bacterium]|nr:OmpH family outer membrane protein [Flavobacteriia bacterium]